MGKGIFDWQRVVLEEFGDIDATPWAGDLLLEKAPPTD